MKKITVPKKKLLRLEKSFRDIRLDLHLFQFGMSSLDEKKLYKRMFKEAAKSISIIEKVIRSKEKYRGVTWKLNGYVKFLVT